jgi:hypothetical protein
MSRFVFGLLLATAACVSCADSQRASTASAAASSATCLSPPFPKWTLSEAEILPQDRSLARPEDGKALPDDRLVVVDEEHGLRVIDPDGSNRPFGGFEKAGYRHNPPESPAGANGMYLERDNRHASFMTIRMASTPSFETAVARFGSPSRRTTPLKTVSGSSTVVSTCRCPPAAYSSCPGPETRWQPRQRRS